MDTLKNTKIGFQDQLSLNAGQKSCRMLHGEHSAILSTFIKLPNVIRSLFCLFLSGCFKQFYAYGPRHEISNNVVYATSIGSEQPTHRAI